MKILVTGGAGYIGSFMTKRLLDEGFNVVVLDSLERGYKEIIDQRAKFVETNILDKEKIGRVFQEELVDSVIHFAGYISMGESMENPYIYFENNTYGSLNLLEQMKKSGVKKMLFSSTAGVYGNSTVVPISENHVKDPTNPYGESKRMVERILSWYERIHSISFVSLRYFNASGAALDANMGENHDPETHIIPNAIKAILTDTEFSLYGTDYGTPDGTCIRDYVHILDLVEAHMLALKKLHSEKGKFVYNVGTGTGYSNKQVLETIEKVSGKNIKIKSEERRFGDAEILVADSSRIQRELNFAPQYSDLETIIKTAWEWHKKNSE